MAKRKNGEGSYGECTKNGIKYKYFKDPNGKFTYAKTSKELNEKLKKKKEEEKNNPIPDGDNKDATFEEYCTAWLKSKKRDITDRVYDDYELIIRTRVKPFFLGKTEVRSITLKMINSYLDELSEKYSRGTIDKTWVVVGQVLKYGVAESDIPKINMDKIRKPKESEVAVKKKDVPFISLDDMEKLYTESQKPKYGDGAKVLMFIMYTGLRLSEAIGLTWDNCSGDFDWIKVTEASSKIIVRDDNGEAVIGEDGTRSYKTIKKDPKSASGIRTIPLSNRASDILRYFASNSHENSSNVFLNSEGKIFEKRALERTLETMLKNSNCSRKDYTPHSLRHGFGSVLISKGVDIKIVSKLLGHKKISTTYDIYIGTYREDEIAAIKNVFD